MNQITIPISNSTKQTTYIVGSDMLASLDEIKQIADLRPTKFLLLSDETVFKLYGGCIINSLRKFEQPILPSIIPAGENQKTLRGLEKAITPFFQSGFDKNAVLVALGGGVITDMGGFLASVLLRGIKGIYIPTTLLSQVDAAIGGKTGVDYILPGGKMFKNMLGTITQPDVVISDTSVLATLPKRELLCGLGEMLKYTIAYNIPSKSDLFCVAGNSFQKEEWEKIIVTCQAKKLEKVTADPYDTLGIREELNLGHTFAHAIESATNAKWSHGQAVALGLLAAAHLSVKMKLCPESVRDTIEKLLTDLELPIRLPDARIQHLMTAFRMDKKGGTFVLIKDFGKIQTRVTVPRELVIETLSELSL